MTSRADGERVAALLGLEPLPGEGGLFRRTHLDAHSSAIHYLLLAPDVSALHVLGSTEVYHWYAGAPLRLLLLRPDGGADEPVLGPDLAAAQRPQVVAPAGTWQGSSPLGAWSLVGATTAPPFDWTHFRLGDRRDLTARYPGVAHRIRELTRDSDGTAPVSAGPVSAGPVSAGPVSAGLVSQCDDTVRPPPARDRTPTEGGP